MKVIENNDTIKVTCPGCRSILEITWQDIKWDDVAHHGTGQWVTCPECSAHIPITLSSIPPRWRAKIFPPAI